MATLLGRSDRALAANDDPLLLGRSDNSATNSTFVGATVDGGVGLAVENFGTGNSFEAASQSATAVFGFSQGSGMGGAFSSQTGTGVHGGSESGTAGSFGSQSGDGVVGFSNGSGRGGVFHSVSGPGLEASSQSDVAVHGFTGGGGTGLAGSSDTGFGVSGHSESGNGVHGDSPTGFAVTGNSPHGIGVRGLSSEDGTGGQFASTNGVAIEVLGRAKFSTAGSGTVPQGQSSVFVSNQAVTAGSHVCVTLASDPGGRELKWVETTPGSGFTVHAPGPAKARPATAFSYLIVEIAT